MKNLSLKNILASALGVSSLVLLAGVFSPSAQANTTQAPQTTNASAAGTQLAWFYWGPGYRYYGGYGPGYRNVHHRGWYGPRCHRNCRAERWGGVSCARRCW